MNISELRLQIYPPAPRHTNLIPNSPLFFTPFKQLLHVSHSKVTTVVSRKILGCPPKTRVIERQMILQRSQEREQTPKRELTQVSSSGYSRFVIVGAVSVGLALLLIGVDVEKAAALGPEGPLMEEFWDNVRRYALYALTVSTGAIYTIFQPILELLKNPISAILILVIIGGSIYIVSQILSAMVGVSDFTYSYGY
ncbi:uncharacterized protein LOC111274062 [Durio zibethinus]|uniref:Uncharacterized protein ycf33 n=1 Tax=Durio zibethinus TaxID=66656 RepID=A0A6P5WEE6_DURZI|nr:uncharacterized protein LOC111274062 [Durio zibethinus]